MIRRDLAEYQFIIPGACPPKGSRTPVGKGRATRESSKRVEPWMKAAMKHLQDGEGQPRARFEGPVYVNATFFFQRPKVTEFEFPTAPSIGDVDKLVRTALDALTRAKVIVDDRYVVMLGIPGTTLHPEKMWSDTSCTAIRVGSARLGCPARLPGGDGKDCTCADPVACGDAAGRRSF